MTSLEADVSQVFELGVKLKASAKRLPKGVGPVTRAAGLMTQREAMRRCPVDTGALRSSITSSTSSDRVNYYSVEVGPTQSYGHYVEFGTSRMRPQPYMVPAFDLVVPQFVSALEQLGKGALD